MSPKVDERGEDLPDRDGGGTCSAVASPVEIALGVDTCTFGSRGVGVLSLVEEQRRIRQPEKRRR
jgi:hypothetical protein